MMQTIPQLGLWTWRLKGEKALSAVQAALELGYRHLDTARIYGNEKEVWITVQNSWIPREQLRITTKVRFDFVPNHEPHDFQESDFHYTQLKTRFDQTLKDLKTEYLDLVLLHWPTTPDNDAQAFETLLSLKKAGKIRQIGVANFPLSQLELLYQRFGSEIFTNQIEWHACLATPALEAFAQEKKLILTAYSPLGQGHLLQNQTLMTLAQELGISIAQLAIAYLVAKGAVVIPKASSRERLQENLEAMRLRLPEQAMITLDTLPKTYRYCNPPFAPQWE